MAETQSGGAARKSARRRAERILIVDDEKLLRWSLKERLSAEGYRVLEAGSGAEGRALLDKGFIDLVLLDLKLPDINGLELLGEIREKHEDIAVVMMTAFSSVENAVEAMRIGAYSYLTKPFDMDGLAVTVEKALEATRLLREVTRLRAQADSGFDTIVFDSPAMTRVTNTLSKVARSPAATVLLTGESGVGKDLCARAIHSISDRRGRPFMNVTCTAISENLLESELFGHERGAFTDAKSSKKGLFELADGGTVFLDEIGDMPQSLQAKLLRFLQEKTFKRVGGSDDVTVDVRIIAATNKDLEKLVAEGVFREDLFYRLNVIPIVIPPLRERGRDIALIARSFVDHYNKTLRKHVKGITEDALEQLQAYHWPGNVRELKNIIERAMILGEGDWITADDLPFGAPKASPGNNHAPEDPGESKTFVLPKGGIKLEELEQDLIRQALKRSGGVKTRAGALLGLNRDQIRYRMKIYKIKLDG